MSTKLSRVALSALIFSILTLSLVTVTEARTENRCQQITTRIENVTNGYNTSKDRHIANYNHIKSRIESFIVDLKAKDYDVDAVETDLNQLDTYVKNLATEYTQFITKLNETKQIACGNSNGDYRAKLGEARKELSDVRELSQATRQFIVTQLRVNLLDLKSQIQARN